eukprot:s1119_g11.t1
MLLLVLSCGLLEVANGLGGRRGAKVGAERPAGSVEPVKKAAAFPQTPVAPVKPPPPPGPVSCLKQPGTKNVTRHPVFTGAVTVLRHPPVKFLQFEEPGQTGSCDGCDRLEGTPKVMRYHEVHFGKVAADFYIDDRGVDPLLGDLDKQIGFYTSDVKVQEASSDVAAARLRVGTAVASPKPSKETLMGLAVGLTLGENPRLFASFLALSSHLFALAPHGALSGESKAYGSFRVARGPMYEMLSHETAAGLALLAQLSVVLRSAVARFAQRPQLLPRAAQMLAAAGLMSAGAEAHQGVASLIREDSAATALSEVVLHSLSLLMQLVPALAHANPSGPKCSLQAVPLLTTLLEVLGQLMDVVATSEEVLERQQQRQASQDAKMQDTGSAPGWPARAPMSRGTDTFSGAVQVLRTPEDAVVREASETQVEHLDRILYSGFSSLVFALAERTTAALRARQGERQPGPSQDKASELLRHVLLPRVLNCSFTELYKDSWQIVYFYRNNSLNFKQLLSKREASCLVLQRPPMAGYCGTPVIDRENEPITSASDSVSVSQFPTLNRYIMGKTGDKELAILLMALQLACKATSRACNKAGIAMLFGLAGEVNSTGDDQKKLDVLSNEIFIDALTNCGACAVLVSEENEDPIFVPQEKAGRFVVAFDPLDGSSNIDCNVSTGTIFAVYEKQHTGPATVNDILRTGNDIMVAGYCMYGAATELVITFKGHGVHRFTLDPSLGEFVHIQAHVKLPEGGGKKIYSCNEGRECAIDSWG